MEDAIVVFCPSMIGHRKAHVDIELGVVVFW
jgi:hypothetical protein